MWTSTLIRPDPLNILYHFAAGYLPDFLDKHAPPAGWVRWSHRGLQYLDKLRIPRKQRPYIFSPDFQLRFDHAFEQVLLATADPARPAVAKRAGQTWITDDLIHGLLKLHRRGFAHSFETWQAGQLVGGIWGIHIGSFITMSSMFARVSNASKAAMARTMLHLRDRGFPIVDMGMVPDHLVHFGAEWVPRWKFEAMLPSLLARPLALQPNDAPPLLPLPIRAALPILRFARKCSYRLTAPRNPPATPRPPAAQTAPHT